MIALQRPETNKLVRSLAISGGGVILGILFLLALRYLFPDFDATELTAMIFAAIGAWVVNLIKESTTTK